MDYIFRNGWSVRSTELFTPAGEKWVPLEGLEPPPPSIWLEAISYDYREHWRVIHSEIEEEVEDWYVRSTAFDGPPGREPMFDHDLVLEVFEQSLYKWLVYAYGNGDEQDFAVGVWCSVVACHPNRDIPREWRLAFIKEIKEFE